MYPVLNQASCHEDLWGSGGTVPWILNLGTGRITWLETYFGGTNTYIHKSMMIL